MLFLYFFISLLVFLIFFQFNKQIANFFNVFDKNKIPLIGGLFLFIGLIINKIYLLNNSLLSIYFVDLFYLISIFIVALLDDRFSLDPYFRLIFIVIIISLFINYEYFFIQTLNFKYFSFFYTPDNNFIKIILPIFCIIVFINAYNFTDGINCLATLLGISWFTYLAIKYHFLIEIYFIFFIFMVLFLFLNYKNKSYLGDSGNYIISIIIGYLLITINRTLPNSIYIEEIFLLLIIPGLDLIRLFFIRIRKKQSPFKGDLNHLHHHLYKKYGLFKTLIIYLTLVNLPMYIFLINEEALIFLIFFSIIVYFYLIKKNS